MRVLAALLLAVTACAGTHSPLAPPPDEDDPRARRQGWARQLEGYHAAFVLAWNGARIGEARERFDEVPAGENEGGWRYVREERLSLKRGGEMVASTMRITVDLDGVLVARRV